MLAFADEGIVEDLDVREHLPRWQKPSLNPTDAPFAGTSDLLYPSHWLCARGVQNTSSDFTNDSISLWCSRIPSTGMLCAWIDFNFRWACSSVRGTRFGGGHGRPRGTAS